MSSVGTLHSFNRPAFGWLARAVFTVRAHPNVRAHRVHSQDSPCHRKARTSRPWELAHGKSPEMKAVAQQIIATQNNEIAQFDQWLANKK